MIHQVLQFRSVVRSATKLGLIAGAIFAVAACSSPPADEAASETEARIVAPASSINLYVIDQGSEAPIKDVQVRLIDGSKTIVSSATTDAFGLINVKFPSSGKFTLTATHRGHSVGISGFDTAALTDAQKTVLSLSKLQKTDVGDSEHVNGDAPGDADITKEFGRTVISSSGAGTTLFNMQGPATDNANAAVPLFGAPNKAYKVVEMDPGTLQPLSSAPLDVTADADGVLIYTLSAKGRAALGGQGVLLALENPDLLNEAPIAPAPPVRSPTPGAPPGAPISPRDVVPLPGGGNVGVGTGFPDTCGPPGATCIQASLPTGNVQTFCPPATNAPYCTVSFSATVGATVAVTPFGVGIDITGSFTAGVSANVYANGTGTFQCNVKVTACAWKQPGTWVRKFGFYACTTFGIPDICLGWRWVFVPGSCGGGGLQPPLQAVFPNLGISNGFCTCFNWSVAMDKIKNCDGTVVTPPAPPPVGAVQCVTCAAQGIAPTCQGTKLDANNKTVPNGINEACGSFGFLSGGKCPAQGVGWSDAPGPNGCSAR